jgi:hypothetical protein
MSMSVIPLTRELFVKGNGDGLTGVPLTLKLMGEIWKPVLFTAPIKRFDNVLLAFCW